MVSIRVQLLKSCCYDNNSIVMADLCQEYLLLFAVLSTFANTHTQMGKPQCKHGLLYLSMSGLFTKFAVSNHNWPVLLCTIDLAAIIL